MSKLDSSKLLPSAKESSAIVKTDKPSVTIKEKKVNLASSIKPIDLKSSALSKDVVKDKKVDDAKDANNKLVKIEKFFKSDLLVSQKKAEVEKKEKEKEDFGEAEKKLELPKLKGFQLPKLPSIPSLGIFERIKRFLFFTALGWLLPKIIEFMPKLNGIIKVIGSVYQFAEGLFGKLFDGFMSLVKFGGDLKDKTIGFISNIKTGSGGDFQKEFDRLEKLFNIFTNASIVAGLLAADIGLAAFDEYNKWRKKSQKPEKPKTGGKPPKSTKPTSKGGKAGKPPSSWSKFLKGPLAKLKGPLSRFAGSVVPGLGAAVGVADAKARFASGDNFGGTLASVSASIDGLSAALALTGIGIPGAAVLAPISMGIDTFLLIRDIIKAFKIPISFIPGFYMGGRVVRKYQGGGTTTRGGKPVNTPKRRSITPAKRKPFKFKTPKSQPGKDVGGDDVIKSLYPDPDPTKPMSLQEWMSRGDQAGTYADYLKMKKQSTEKDKQKPNSYKALTSTAKILKEIPLLGGIMGAAVDVALGQKPDYRIFLSLSSRIGNLVETLANQKVNLSITSLNREISSFADGGYVSPSRELKKNYDSLSSGDLISKVIGSNIEQRVNEAIQNVQKELMKQQKKTRRSAADTLDEMNIQPGSSVSGSVSGGNADFWTLVAIAALENDTAQGRSDVAQSIYNRVASRLNFGQKSNTIKGHIIAPRQYSPVHESENPELWAAITDRQSAIAAVESHRNGKGRGAQIIDSSAVAIMNPSLQKKSAEYIGGRTDFWSVSMGIPSRGHGFVIRDNHRFGWFSGPESIAYGRRNPGPAVVPSLGGRIVISESSAGSVPSGTGLIPHRGPGGFIQGGSGSRRGQPVKEDAFPIHFHLSPPSISPEGFAKARNVAFHAVKMMLARGSSVLLSNVNKYVPKGINDQKLKNLILAEQRAHTKSGRTQGGIDIAEIHPRSGLRIAFPLSVGRVTGLKSGYGRESEVIGSGGVLLAHGAAGSTATDMKNIEKELERRRQMEESASNRPPSTLSQPGSRPGQSQRPQNPANVLKSLVKKSFIPFDVDGNLYVMRYYENGNRRIFRAINIPISGPVPIPGSEVKSSDPSYKIIIKFANEKTKDMYPLPLNFFENQSGGLIAPSKPNIPIPNSFASYETYGSGTMFAIQPILIPTSSGSSGSSGNKMIAFPIAISVNNSTEKLNLSRG